MSAVVCNASPLIAFAQIGELEILRRVFGSLIVPPAVRDEIAPTLSPLPVWIEVHELKTTLPSQILGAKLGLGESQTLALALEIHARKVILDERAARRLAFSLGLEMLGCAGILQIAKIAGHIPAVKPPLDAFVSAGFRLSSALYEQILRDVGEI